MFPEHRFTRIMIWVKELVKGMGNREDIPVKYM